MTRLKLLFAFTISIILVSLICAMVLYLIPSSFFSSEGNKFIIGLVSTLFIAVISGIIGYYFSRYTDRPIIRIEHVNFKSKRKSFEIPDKLWFYMIHEKGFLEYLDK